VLFQNSELWILLNVAIILFTALDISSDFYCSKSLDSHARSAVVGNLLFSIYADVTTPLFDKIYSFSITITYAHLHIFLFFGFSDLAYVFSSHTHFHYHSCSHRLLLPVSENTIQHHLNKLCIILHSINGHWI
jgi:hypothetical protein